MLTAEEAYVKHAPAFRVIPESEVQTPKMSREDVIGEAEELKIVAGEDEEVLVKAGCDREYIQTLDERIGAYAHASSLYENSSFAVSAARDQWLKEEAPAFEFKEELVHDFQHAFRNMPEQLKYVAKISAGHGRRDLVMDLKDLATLGAKNSEALKTINFDMQKLERAKALYGTLSDLLSESVMTPDEIETLKMESFKAYTFLQRAVAEIRENGQYVFWKNPTRLALYKSEYYQTIGKIKNKNKDKAQEMEVAVK